MRPRLDALMERAAAASGAEATERWQRVEATLAARGADRSSAEPELDSR